ncbi:hypothetical protein ACRAWD_24595 [Caulobacter segnis]
MAPDRRDHHPQGPAGLLDQLDGAAISSRYGQARHEVQIQGGYFKDGLGMRFNGTWKASTWVDGGSTGGQTLYFSDLATVGVNFFANFSAPARKKAVDNVPDPEGRPGVAELREPARRQADGARPERRHATRPIRRTIWTPWAAPCGSASASCSARGKGAEDGSAGLTRP